MLSQRIIGCSLATAFVLYHARKTVLANFLKQRRSINSKTGIVVTSTFDSGNIYCLDASDAKNIKLKLEEEPFTKFTDKKCHSQWFHFQVSNVKGQDIVLNITNAGNASYADAFEGYWAFISYDRKNWTRTKSTYTNGELKIMIDKCKSSNVWVSYFPPYSYERHLHLIGKAQADERFEVSSLGTTIMGRSMDCLKIGNGKLKVWIIARQHPGESQAEWWMDGFVNTLLETGNKTVETLLSEATVYLIPNMNPDGAVHGHLRTNAEGANLNREWGSNVYGSYQAPTVDLSPEVHHVLAKMDKTGVDFFLDVHGDEALPVNFLSGGQGIPNWNNKHAWLFQTFAENLVKCSKGTFQTKLGYGNDEALSGNLAIGSNQIGHRFDCLSSTLEMPYKKLI
eukprot:UN25634